LTEPCGNTAHLLQVVGWLPIHPLRDLAAQMPYWTGLWFGLYATWEGLLLQAAAAAFTIGSYYLAEYMHKREVRAARSRTTAMQI
jgi:high-affinity iron transporter